MIYTQFYGRNICVLSAMHVESVWRISLAMLYTIFILTGLHVYDH